MKNMLPYYKRYPRDFIEGTIGMDLELKGAYSILLDLIYMQGGNLPDDERYISGLLGCKPAKWMKIREALLSLGKIIVFDKKISNSRAVLEINEVKTKSETNAKNARGPRKNKEITETKTEIPLSHPEPEPEPEEKKKASPSKKGTRLPEDFEPDLDAAIDAGLRPERALMEAAKFKDYWQAKTGKDATKLDWKATWRNWFRNAIERQGAPRGSPAQSRYQEGAGRVRADLERSARGDDNGKPDFNNGQPAFDLDPTDYRRR